MEIKKNEFNSVVTTVVFIVMFVFVGIPVWWKTTEIYRYPVPHEECKQLVTEQVQHTVPVKLILDDLGVKQSELWEFLLQNSEVNAVESSKPLISFHWSMTFVSEEESFLIRNISNISDLDTALSAELSKSGDLWTTGEIKILILNKNFTSESAVVIGRHKFGYVLSDQDSMSLANNVLTVARKMAQVFHLQKLSSPSSDYSMDKKPDKSRMRAFRSLIDFDITFSLLVSDTRMLPVQWDIKKAVNDYFTPIIEKLSDVYNINVKSQILYVTPLPLPKRIGANVGEEIVPIEMLSSIINPTESRLGSDISVHQNLNFVIYVPTIDQSPLRIYDSQGNPVRSNAFLVPQWGGFVLQNCPAHQKCPFSSHDVMQTFVNQLHLLLGLPDVSELQDNKCQVLRNPFLSQWELDFLVRKSVQDYLGASTRSLASLSQLLHSIGNIVIHDDVGLQIESAVRSCRSSFLLLKEGLLREALKEAKAAFRASESVFFDPSLLALLYFPEDQKYAIYIPLFLPVSIPVLSSIFRIFKSKRE